MTWTLIYAASAARAIKRLDPAVRRRMLAALQKLRDDPERGKPLQLALRGLRSWRTHDYRIVYRIIESRIEVLVVAVGHRRDVYERLKKTLDAGR
ncbi:MAG: type II toxin-antitoxin system RelE/ParE family toxin [Acidobacteria bacterium]|nr:type II toxin-antitoxin system RelE/ParE family toxin [Acidobacteriota bacterium]